MKQFFLSAMMVASFAAFGQSKKDLDRQAILKMEGCYKVNFFFGETYSDVKDYEYHDRYFEHGVELVKVIQNKENFISLQHLLVVKDTMVVKHWRQDWVFENQTMLAYDKDQTWKNIQITPEQAKGTWTQKVYQVDDSPRYEGYGTWVHADGRSFWESKSDAPLPRREHTKRDDYNVVGRFSHIEIFNNGWVLDQDNEKIVREDGKKDFVLVHEKGIERFTSGAYNCKAAEDYWEKTADFWAVVREIWTEKLAKGTIKVDVFKNGNVIYMKMFELADKAAKAKKFNAKEIKASVTDLIEMHTTIK